MSGTQLKSQEFDSKQGNNHTEYNYRHRRKLSFFFFNKKCELIVSDWNLFFHKQKQKVYLIFLLLLKKSDNWFQTGE